MAIVAVGPVGADVVVPTDVCVKSGVPTRDRVTIRGSTTPGWVWVLLLLTIVGWIFVSIMTSRRYRIEVPFRHDLNDRWRRTYRIATGLVVAGFGATIAAIIARLDHALVPLLLVVAGLLIGTVNGLVRNVGVRQIGDERLALTRVHPAAAAAITRARAERDAPR
ncbi:MAG: hypothetical protein FWD95_11095 [Nocardioidaceae bacterium]|nr:hypothetical protein [Nocardioidaceae bacterium]